MEGPVGGLVDDPDKRQDPELFFCARNAEEQGRSTGALCCISPRIEGSLPVLTPCVLSTDPDIISEQLARGVQPTASGFVQSPRRRTDQTLDARPPGSSVRRALSRRVVRRPTHRLGKSRHAQAVERQDDQVRADDGLRVRNLLLVLARRPTREFLLSTTRYFSAVSLPGAHLRLCRSWSVPNLANSCSTICPPLPSSRLSPPTPARCGLSTSVPTSEVS